MNTISSETVDTTPRSREVESYRLLLLSDKTPKSYRIAECCLSNVILIHFKNDSSLLNDLLQDAIYKCDNKQIDSVAFMCHSQDAMIHLCSSVEKVIKLIRLMLEKIDFVVKHDFSSISLKIRSPFLRSKTSFWELKIF